MVNYLGPIQGAGYWGEIVSIASPSGIPTFRWHYDYYSLPSGQCRPEISGTITSRDIATGTLSVINIYQIFPVPDMPYGGNGVWYMDINAIPLVYPYETSYGLDPLAGGVISAYDLYTGAGAPQHIFWDGVFPDNGFSGWGMKI